jgi:acyl-coenzyme A synthetase/AMP-(fatty) acid ligase
VDRDADPFGVRHRHRQPGDAGLRAVPRRRRRAARARPRRHPGYFNRPDATAELFDDDGWLRTGDLATIDGQGRVRIVDRKKEMIINSAGHNMSPANIETR